MQPLVDLSKERLIDDLAKLRERVHELERIKAEKEKYAAELAHTKSMFEGLFQFAPDAILVISSKGFIAQANQEAERLFGYAHDELIGLDHDIIVPERFHARHMEDRKLYVSAPHVRQMGTGLELFGRRKDGTEFPVDISLGPLQAIDEIVTLAVIRDITQRKQMEKDLERHRKHLEEMALFTGMRRGELMKLKWRDVDFDRGFISIMNPKGVISQKIPLNDQARDILVNHRKKSDHIFANGLPFTNVINKRVRAIRKGAGLPDDFRPLHGLHWLALQAGICQGKRMLRNMFGACIAGPLSRPPVSHHMLGPFLLTYKAARLTFSRHKSKVL